MKFIDLTSTLSKQTRVAALVAALMALAGPASAFATDTDAARATTACCSGSPATEADAVATPQPAQETASGEHGQHYAGGKKARRHGSAADANTVADTEAGNAAAAPTAYPAHKRHYAGGKKARRHGVPAFGTRGCPSTCAQGN